MCACLCPSRHTHLHEWLNDICLLSLRLCLSRLSKGVVAAKITAAPCFYCLEEARRVSVGVSPSRCRSSTASLSASVPTHVLHCKIFHWDEAAIRSPCTLPIPFASRATHPPLTLFLPSNPSIPPGNRAVERGWHFGGGGSRGALTRRRCRVLCA